MMSLAGIRRRFFRPENKKKISAPSPFSPSTCNRLWRRNHIRILAQERLLGATLGTLFTGIIVFEQRRYIYKTFPHNLSQSPHQAQVKEPILGNKSHSEVAHLWNRTVDRTFGPLIESLSSLGW